MDTQAELPYNEISSRPILVTDSLSLSNWKEIFQKFFGGLKYLIFATRALSLN